MRRLCVHTHVRVCDGCVHVRLHVCVHACVYVCVCVHVCLLIPPAHLTLRPHPD